MELNLIFIQVESSFANPLSKHLTMSSKRVQHNQRQHTEVELDGHLRDLLNLVGRAREAD